MVVKKHIRLHTEVVCFLIPADKVGAQCEKSDTADGLVFVSIASCKLILNWFRISWLRELVIGCWTSELWITSVNQHWPCSAQRSLSICTVVSNFSWANLSCPGCWHCSTECWASRMWCPSELAPLPGRSCAVSSTGTLSWSHAAGSTCTQSWTLLWEWTCLEACCMWKATQPALLLRCSHCDSDNLPGQRATGILKIILSSCCCSLEPSWGPAVVSLGHSCLCKFSWLELVNMRASPPPHLPYWTLASAATVIPLPTVSYSHSCSTCKPTSTHQDWAALEDPFPQQLTALKYTTSLTIALNFWGAKRKLQSWLHSCIFDGDKLSTPRTVQF